MWANEIHDVRWVVQGTLPLQLSAGSRYAGAFRCKMRRGPVGEDEQGRICVWESGRPE